jgi:long-chain acyl-CoA synthetase
MRKYDDPRLMSHLDLMASGQQLDDEQPERYMQLVNQGKAEDVAILCPTSGTTSNPKLAMLQAGPMLEHCVAYLEADPKYPSDNYVSVLPLPWIMEQVYAVAQALISRIIVNFVEEPETMMEDLREIGPTFVLLAPRVWESVAADVKAKMMDATRFKQAMYRFAIKTGLLAAVPAPEGSAWLHLPAFCRNRWRGPRSRYIQILPEYGGAVAATLRSD